MQSEVPCVLALIPALPSLEVQLDLALAQAREHVGVCTAIVEEKNVLLKGVLLKISLDRPWQLVRHVKQNLPQSPELILHQRSALHLKAVCLLVKLSNPRLPQLRLLLIVAPYALELCHVDAGEVLVSEQHEEGLDRLLVVPQALPQATDGLDDHRLEALVDQLHPVLAVGDEPVVPLLAAPKHLAEPPLPLLVLHVRPAALCEALHRQPGVLIRARRLLPQVGAQRAEAVLLRVARTDSVPVPDVPRGLGEEAHVGLVLLPLAPWDPSGVGHVCAILALLSRLCLARCVLISHRKRHRLRGQRRQEVRRRPEVRHLFGCG
mmetsp:Transcript_29981/g.73808  ORF Transcript_29981/g.73808 Transcript_29981/m.73808 type:complete len:321 (+) Transcript_29981:863-1825(+)